MLQGGENMATAKTIIQTLGSVAAATMVARTIMNDFLPDEFQDYVFSTVRSVFSRCFSSQTTLIINEYDGLETNQIYQAAELYLGTLTKSNSNRSAASARRLRVNKPESEDRIQVALDQDEEIMDEYEGKKFKWVLHFHHIEPTRHGRVRREIMGEYQLRSYHLSFHKKLKDLALDKYLYHVLSKAALLKQENKTIKLFTIDFRNIYGSPADVWTSINLNHPATFETLAMDPELKKLIMSDLDRFVERKEYYRRVGKAWKRGYLLHGPPGTGKSSLIAAMANHLNFDIYDLQLGEVKCDSDLRKMLVGTGNRSILIVEDIDCSVKLEDREGKKKGGGNDDDNSSDSDDDEDGGNSKSRVTLSGLLNFIDGLWSSCGDERIIIFTTNYKDKLDPALLRPGRMDMHIHMSYCTASAFKVLAKNYLKLEAHGRFEEIEGLIEAARVTPAEVAEQLIKYEEGQADGAMVGLVEFLRVKIEENGGIVGEDKGVKIEGVGDHIVKKLD